MKITNRSSEFKVFIAFAYTALVTVTSLISISNVPTIKLPYKDKIIHLLFYLLMVIIWFWSIKKKNYKNLTIIVVISIIYGIIIEVLQKELTQYRTFDKYDILANTMGAIVAYLFCMWFLKKNYSNSTINL